MKPLLAATIEDTAKLEYPCLVSPKLDGIRCLIINGVAMSRSLKPIRNRYVQSLFGKHELNGVDGELIVGCANSPDVYRTTNSGVMSEDGEPDVFFHMFDRFDINDGFSRRYAQLPRESDFLVRVPHHYVSAEWQLLELETKYLEQGYEGKRFTDAEFVVVGFEERMHNANEAKTNALGHTERSAHKANLVGRGDLGALVLRYEGGTFNCGTGFTDEDRADIWANRDKYLGSQAKIKSFLIGVKDAPRFPVFLGFKDVSDT